MKSYSKKLLITLPAPAGKLPGLYAALTSLKKKVVPVNLKSILPSSAAVYLMKNITCCTTPMFAERTEPADALYEIWMERGRNPSEKFDDRLYLQNKPGLLSANVNPLLDYLRTGSKVDSLRAFQPK